MEVKELFQLVATPSSWLSRIREKLKEKQITEEEVNAMLNELNEISKKKAELEKDFIDEYGIDSCILGFGFSESDNTLSINYKDYQEFKDFVRKYFWWDRTAKEWRLKDKIKKELLDQFMEIYKEAKKACEERVGLEARRQKLKRELLKRATYKVADMYESYTRGICAENTYYTEFEQVAKLFAGAKGYREVDGLYVWSEKSCSY